jgi:magnesium transporter
MSYKTINLQYGRWIDVELPNQSDLEYLRNEFSFIHPTNLEDAFQRVSRAKVDINENYVFLSVTVPTKIVQGHKATNFELSLFLTKDALVTITHERTDIFKQEQKEAEEIASVTLPENPQILAYRFLEILYELSSKAIEKINNSISHIDDHILDITSKEIIRDISVLQRNIIYFMTTVRASIPIFEELEHKNVSFSASPMKEFWGDLVDRLKQQRDVLEEYDTTLSKLAKSHETYLSFHTNNVISILTVVSVIFMPLNLVAGIYGMNFSNIPTLEHPLGFYMSLLTMLIISVSLIVYFRYKKWM